MFVSVYGKKSDHRKPSYTGGTEGVQGVRLIFHGLIPSGS